MTKYFLTKEFFHQGGRSKQLYLLDNYFHSVPSGLHLEHITIYDENIPLDSEGMSD